MPLHSLSNKLLYVPFTQEYEVPEEIKRELKTDEFFRFCFVPPSFQKEIEEIKSLTGSEVDAAEYPLRKSELLNVLDLESTRMDIFNNWLASHGGGAFCLLGDAGTGKTTYLHYLQWEQTDRQWAIIDVQKATQDIEVMTSDINFSEDDFSILHGKVIAALLLEIKNTLFINEAGATYDCERSYKTIRRLLKGFDQKIVPSFPNRDYSLLYEQLSDIALSGQSLRSKMNYCDSCAQVFAAYFNEQCAGINKDPRKRKAALKCVLTHYMIVLRCLGEAKKTVLAFDNLERFIGVDEIYNQELIQFVSNLRRISDSYGERFLDRTRNINLFARNYQFIISMRNTTVRNFTPQQNADFFEHSIDLSDWFPIGQIISQKLTWYDEHGFDVMEKSTAEQMMYILDDLGLTTSDIIRGLRPKLSLIFNYNKRLITEFLVKIFTAQGNPPYLAKAEDFRRKDDRDNGNQATLARFAYRSIIWRLVFDQLREGELFKSILNPGKPQDSRIMDIKYAWGLLTILSNHSLKERAETRYMPFNELMREFFNREERLSDWFYDKGGALDRERISDVLYHMNYYSKRENNWFQFVDIQYNVSAYHKKHLKSADDLLTLIEQAKDAPQDINVRITNAGKAYLGYMVQAFEFISCISKKHPPLLFCLPTENELMEKQAGDLACVQVIKDILEEVRRFIENKEEKQDAEAQGAEEQAADEQDAEEQNAGKQDAETKRPDIIEHISFKKTVNDPGRNFADRLVHSHIGYLDNFCECLEEFVEVEDEEAAKKKGDLIAVITQKREELRTRWAPKAKAKAD